MFQIMTDVPAHVVGVRAVGQVTKDDYEQTLVPALEKVSKQFGELNFIMVFETDLSSFTYGAWMQDAKISFKHFAKWNKIAIVIDKTMIQKLSYVFNYISPAESKGFSLEELETAKAWVAAPKEATANA
jgi:hypothetical protein